MAAVLSYNSSLTQSRAPILWSPDAMSQLIGKDPNTGKDGRQKRKRAAEDEMVREHHRLNGCDLEQTPGDRGGDRSLACPVHEIAEPDMT